MAAVIVLPASAHALPGAKHLEEVYFFAHLARFDASASSRSSRGEIQTVVAAEIELAEPITAHEPLRNKRSCKGCIVITERGECRFVEKYERLAESGAAAIVIANQSESHADTVFAMTGALKRLKHLPPCVMVSFNDYRALRASGVTRATVRPMIEDDLAHLKRTSLPAAVRACVTQRSDALLLATLEEAKRRGMALSDVLDEQEEDRGCTAVHLAVEHGNRFGLEILLRHRAHPDLLKKDGYSPLHMAVEKKAHDMIALLLHHGAYVDRQHTLGWTSLHFAAKSGAEESVTALLTVGANPNAIAQDRSTPLHVACMFGQAGVVRVLLQNQARCDVLNAKQRTPLEVAQRLNFAPCVHLIEAHVKELHRSLQGDNLEPDLLRHDEISFGYHLGEETLTYLDSSPPWILEGFEDAVTAIPRFSACHSASPGEGKCMLPVPLAEALEQEGILEHGRLNDAGPNRVKLVEAYKRAAHELANHAEGFMPELRAVFFPDQLRAAMWLAALEPVNASLIADGLEEELLDEALDYITNDVELVRTSGLIRDTDLSKVQSLLTASTGRMSDKSIACRSSNRYSGTRSLRKASMEARAASMKLDLSRHSYRSSDGGMRLASIIQAYLVLSEQHEYKPGLDVLLIPILDSVSDDATVLRVLLCILEQHHNGHFCQDATDSLRPMLENIMGMLKFWDPRLWMMLTAHGISPNAFATSWLATLFANIFELKECLQVWDHMMLFGDRFVSSLGASILLEIRTELGACEDMTDMVLLIASVTNGEFPVNVQKLCQRAVWMFLSTPASLFSFDIKDDSQKIVSMRLPRAVFPSTLNEGRMASQGIPVVALNQLHLAVLPLTIVDIRDTQHDDFLLLKARAGTACPGVTVLHCPMYKLRGVMDYCQSMSLEAIVNEPAMLHPNALLTPHRYEQVIIASDNPEDAKKFATVLVLCAFPRVSILNHRNIAS